MTKPETSGKLRHAFTSLCANAFKWAGSCN